ncbi:3'-5' exonuclease [Fundicoccus culcitae]|uniref:3'-5' exonuclease n=1 Tax=Fundicoccus culcitae TaxID=2969821 RepID=A0ABY5P6G9_9LACT|nr:3'-5' exonuclease [Fundicoccus culcitae]UUX34337.1 3'-5' exonuclease [Fundicoccus culcitae]
MKNTNDFVALDVETANANAHSICSVGIAKFSNGKLIDQYYQLINPEESFRSINISIHGIRPRDVQSKPTFLEMKNDMIKFIDGLPLIAHNAAFDMGALKADYIRYNLSYDMIQYMCSATLSRALVKTVPNHKLSTMANYYQIELNHHHALSDAMASGAILINLMADLQENDLFEFLRRVQYPNLGELGGRGFKKATKKI